MAGRPQARTAARGLQPLAALAAGLFGLCYFVLHSGTVPLMPRQVLWLLRHDWSQHYLGWAFFRHAPLGWPLGALPQVAEPDGTTLALLDGNPLWSFFWRPWAAWLPERWQFIGWYLASNFVLQGIAGAGLAARLGLGGVAQALTGALLVASPVLLHRVPHDTLTAHWLIIAALATFWPAASKAQRARDGLWLAMLPFIAALTHAYLLAMVLPLVWVSAFSRLARARWAEGLGVVVGAACGSVLAAATLYALGLVGEAGSGSASGFGYFSANALTLLDPASWSSWLPALPGPHAGQRFEGFGYLGTGGLLLLVLAISRPKALLGRPVDQSASLGNVSHLTGPLSALPRAGQPAWRPAMGSALLVSALLYAFAWSDQVWVADRLAADLRAIYDLGGPLARLFRCSGRFAWPLGYALLAWSLSRLMAHASPARAATWLAVALALQVGEPNHRAVAQQFAQPQVQPLADPIWQLARGDYAHVALMPPWFPGSDLHCGAVYPDKYEVPLMLFAAEQQLGINSAYLAHYRRHAVSQACRRASELFVHGAFAADTLYVLAPSVLARNRAHHLPLVCALADGYHLCALPGRKDTQLVAALRARQRS